MEERNLAENIMKALGSILVDSNDVLLGGNTIADRYLARIANGNIMKYVDCIDAIRHYVICAGYENDKFVYVLSDYSM